MRALAYNTIYAQSRARAHQRTHSHLHARTYAHKHMRATLAGVLIFSLFLSLSRSPIPPLPPSLPLSRCLAGVLGWHAGEGEASGGGARQGRGRKGGQETATEAHSRQGQRRRRKAPPKTRLWLRRQKIADAGKALLTHGGRAGAGEGGGGDGDTARGVSLVFPCFIRSSRDSAFAWPLFRVT